MIVSSVVTVGLPRAPCYRVETVFSELKTTVELGRPLSRRAEYPIGPIPAAAKSLYAGLRGQRMRIHIKVERVGERCPEDDVMNGWLEDSSVYVSVDSVDEGDVEEPPAEI
jgi:hypothetical protein